MNTPENEQNKTGILGFLIKVFNSILGKDSEKSDIKENVTQADQAIIPNIKKNTNEDIEMAHETQVTNTYNDEIKNIEAEEIEAIKRIEDLESEDLTLNLANDRIKKIEESKRTVNDLSELHDDDMSYEQDGSKKILKYALFGCLGLALLVVFIFLCIWVSNLVRNITSSSSSSTVTSTSSVNIINDTVKTTSKTSIANTNSNQSANTTGKKAFSDKIVQDFLLTGYEAPITNWNIESQNPRSYSDINKVSRDKGWIDGYRSYLTGTFSNNSFKYGVANGSIVHLISRYNPETIVQVFNTNIYDERDDTGNLIFTCIPTRFGSETTINGAIVRFFVANCANDRFIMAQYYKKNIHGILEFRSNSLDQEFFLEIVKAAIDKIN